MSGTACAADPGPPLLARAPGLFRVCGSISIRPTWALPAVGRTKSDKRVPAAWRAAGKIGQAPARRAGGGRTGACPPPAAGAANETLGVAPQLGWPIDSGVR